MNVIERTGREFLSNTIDYDDRVYHEALNHALAIARAAGAGELDDSTHSGQGCYVARIEDNKEQKNWNNNTLEGMLLVYKEMHNIPYVIVESSMNKDSKLVQDSAAI